MANTFNPNEVVFEKIRYIEEFDPSTTQLLTRLTNVKAVLFFIITQHLYNIL